MKTLKLTYKNGNLIVMKNVTDYTIKENKLYYARYSYDGLVNMVVKMYCIENIEEI